MTPTTTSVSAPSTRSTTRQPGELTGLIQPLRLAVHLPSLLVRGPRGHGEHVLVLPGRSFGDLTTLPLRAFLRAKGYRPTGWGLGRNRFPVPETVAPMVDLLQERGAADRPSSLVGQSLGGYLAREVSRQRPDLVDRVVTIGSPIFGATSGDALTRPITALWSAVDRVVPPSRSRDRNPTTEQIEIRSTHFAMGLDPDVWRAVATALAADRSPGATPA